MFLLDQRVFMPLGILRIAAVLEKAGWYVEVLNLAGIENFEEAVSDHVANSQASIFGITATTSEIPATIKIAAAIKRVQFKARIILGGPHTTLACAAVKREQEAGKYNGRAHKALDHLLPIFDVIVAGDGEEAIFIACEDNPPHIIDADGRKSGLFLTNATLEALPFPARHLVDVASYKYTIDGVPALSVIAQLGCPFNCGFCAGRHSPMLRHTRTRSSDSVVAEIVEVYKTYGHKGFMFYDDELNVNPKIVELMDKIHHAQLQLGTEWRLRGFLKAELFTEAQAKAMYRAGFRWILVGFESGSPQILENIQKRATREDNTRCIQLARENGLKVKALMSIGHPGESSATTQETLDWLRATKPDDFDVTIITPYPGSPYYDDATLVAGADNTWAYVCKNGDTLYMNDVNYLEDADYYKGDPDDGYVSHVWTQFLSATDLVQKRDMLERVLRKELGIPFNPSASAVLYEHSMGQSQLPPYILQESAD